MIFANHVSERYYLFYFAFFLYRVTFSILSYVWESFVFLLLQTVLIFFHCLIYKCTIIYIKEVNLLLYVLQIFFLVCHLSLILLFFSYRHFSWPFISCLLGIKLIFFFPDRWGWVFLFMVLIICIFFSGILLLDILHFLLDYHLWIHT